MSYKVEIIEDSGSSSIEIQTSINDQEKSLDILENNTINLSVSHDIALLPSDLNDLITNGVKVFLVSDPLLSTLVSGLVPVRNINGSGYVNITSNSGNFTISVTGLQPSGNYALLSGASFTGLISSPTGIFSSLKSNNLNSIIAIGKEMDLSMHDSESLINNGEITINNISDGHENGAFYLSNIILSDNIARN
jgi:hypothetical protein